MFLFALLLLNHAHLAVSRVLSRIFADLTYLWKISTRLWTMIFSLSYACLTNRRIFSLIVSRSYDVWDCIDNVLCMTRENHEVSCFSEIFRDHHFLKTQFLFYSLIVCYEIHVKLAHINSRWIETIAYRVTLSEMFVCNFLIHASCLNSVEMFQWFISRNFRSVCMLKYDEMFCFICNRRMSRAFFNCCSHAQILSRCL